MAALAVAAAFAVAPAKAVVILDSTWAEEGGTKQSPALGFKAHIALANEPQFRPAIAFTSDGDTWQDCSGTWIGNDATAGYVLTAAHCIMSDRTGGYIYRSDGGAMLEAQHVFRPSEWDDDLERHTGFDIAIVKLTAPVTDAGEPALLFDGDNELGRTVIFAGFGQRGIGSTGPGWAYYAPGSPREEKAAAEARIDEVTPFAGMQADDAGNYFTVFFPKEDGSIENTLGGASTPVSRLHGLPAPGDAGCAGWIRLADGRWTVAGVASDGSEPAVYGEQSWFVRVSHHRAWITSIFPGARFAHD